MISKDKISSWNENYNKKEKILENVISNNSISNLSIVRDKCQNFNPIYNVNVTPHLKVTNQKSSGRCWLFASCNLIRSVTYSTLSEKYGDIENFELSQNS